MIYLSIQVVYEFMSCIKTADLVRGAKKKVADLGVFDLAGGLCGGWTVGHGLYARPYVRLPLNPPRKKVQSHLKR